MKFFIIKLETVKTPFFFTFNTELACVLSVTNKFNIMYTGGAFWNWNLSKESYNENKAFPQTPYMIRFWGLGIGQLASDLKIYPKLLFQLQHDFFYFWRLFLLTQFHCCLISTHPAFSSVWRSAAWLRRFSCFWWRCRGRPPCRRGWGRPWCRPPGGGSGTCPPPSPAPPVCRCQTSSQSSPSIESVAMQ